MDFFLISITIILLGSCLWFFLRPKPAKLSNNTFHKARRAIGATTKLDPNHALIDAHKHFIWALETLVKDYRSPAAKLVTKFAHRFPEQQNVWYYHRSRNQAAHNPNYKVSAKQAEEARKAFLRALSSLR